MQIHTLVVEKAQAEDIDKYTVEFRHDAKSTASVRIQGMAKIKYCPNFAF
jgi:hypothetical protein